MYLICTSAITTFSYTIHSFYTKKNIEFKLKEFHVVL